MYNFQKEKMVVILVLPFFAISLLSVCMLCFFCRYIASTLLAVNSIKQNIVSVIIKEITKILRLVYVIRYASPLNIKLF